MQYDNQNNLIIPDTGKVIGLGAVTPTAQQLTWASSLTLDFTKGNKFRVSLGGTTTTFPNPTITADMIGLEFTLNLDITATNQVIACGTYFRFPNGTAPALSTTIGRRDKIVGEIISTTLIDCTITRGF